VGRNARWMHGSALVFCSSIFACGSTLPEPSIGPHPTNEYVEVPYPPPAAAAEVVPPSPQSGAVWVDGQWIWRGRYYVWQRGGWVIPPAGAYFAPWRKYYTKDGTLYFADGTWRRASDRARIASPPFVRTAETPPTRYTPESVLAH
jgi:hypothetical protein